MTLPLSVYLRLLQETLADEVLPHVSEEHPRSQLLSSINVLEKLAGLTDWSPDLITEQNDALERGIAALSGSASDGTRGSPRRLLAELENRQAELEVAIDHVFEAGRVDYRALTEMTIRRCLLDFLSAERNRFAAANYSAMK